MVLYRCQDIFFSIENPQALTKENITLYVKKIVTDQYLLSYQFEIVKLYSK